MKKIALFCMLVLFAFSLFGCIETVEQHYGNDASENPSGNSSGNSSESGETETLPEDSDTIFLSITCETILDHWDQLDPSLRDEKYVPKDGVILAKTEFVLEEGETAFDLLVRATKQKGIHMEYRGGAGNNLGSIYIEGINHLYEFSCGSLSGWMYVVNGVFPNFGCGNYKLQDGDEVKWVYTCDLGRDVGCDWL